MSCFTPVSTTSTAPPDPTRHVFYSLGMVLGADDLSQEFAYHAHRDQWALRDLVGYGTAWGLKLAKRDGGGTRGPEVAVSAGVAVSPRGQLIRVARDQCAAVNAWLATRTTDVDKYIGAGNVLTLYVILKYRDCATDLVPIAGEPCRTEEDTQAPSRVADDFQLELSFTAPEQQEEDAIREFVHWLATHVEIAGPGAPVIADINSFLDAIRAAAQNPLASPPGSILGPPSSPPSGKIPVPGGQLPEYMRAVLRLWVTELRPKWRPNWLGDRQACVGDYPYGGVDNGNAVLLGRVDVPLAKLPGSSDWGATGVSGISIDESRRPLLMHLRMLQEWMSLLGPTGGAGAVRSVAGVVRTVANDMGLSRGGLRVTGVAGNQVALTFNGYRQPGVGGAQHTYIVHATPVPTDISRAIMVSFESFTATGFNLRLYRDSGNVDMANLRLMIEVTRVDPEVP